ncbi:hypothetical protein N7456_013278 [Penicillium angulare]|uniref:Uncharacterized protein n=1 Tax=Penicillium angulare TaxID=116970 RepID=A0A9W9EG26_9EURO|nr:hypothetical protein N7456_013278 [Penicillium angulare]
MPSLRVARLGRALRWNHRRRQHRNRLHIPPTIPTYMHRIHLMVCAIAAVLARHRRDIHFQLTWRWCFYINLPFGAGTLVALLNVSRSIAERLKKVDFIGLLIFIPTVTCMLVALQWGGTTYPWNDGRVVALFWFGRSSRKGAWPLAWNALCNGAAFFLLIYYILCCDASAPLQALIFPILAIVIMAALLASSSRKIEYRMKLSH